MEQRAAERIETGEQYLASLRNRLPKYLFPNFIEVGRPACVQRLLHIAHHLNVRRVHLERVDRSAASHLTRGHLTDHIVQCKNGVALQREGYGDVE